MPTKIEKDYHLEQSQGGELLPKRKPIVLKYKKWKKKTKDSKPKYTGALKDIQLLQGDAVRAAGTAARALSKSIDVYDAERKKSAKKKRDGAIQDFLQNSARATSTYLKESSDIPIDLADSLNRISSRKNLKKNLRRVSKGLRTWPI